MDEMQWEMKLHVICASASATLALHDLLAGV